MVASGNLRDDNVKYVDKFSLSELKLLGGKWFGDYVRALIMAFMKHGYPPINPPFRAWIRSNVPIASGLGSSGTLLVALAQRLMLLMGLTSIERPLLK